MCQTYFVLLFNNLHKDSWLPWLSYIRIGILSKHELKVEHFPDLSAALKAADDLVQAQRVELGIDLASIPQDRVFPNQPLLDQFWYSWSHGKKTLHKGIWEQKLEMSGKLNDKNLALMKDAGVKSDLLGLPTPNCVDFVAVKNECKAVGELEGELKLLA